MIDTSCRQSTHPQFWEMLPDGGYFRIENNLYLSAGEHWILFKLICHHLLKKIYKDIYLHIFFLKQENISHLTHVQ